MGLSFTSLLHEPHLAFGPGSDSHYTSQPPRAHPSLQHPPRHTLPPPCPAPLQPRTLRHTTLAWPARWCMICTSRCTSPISSALTSFFLLITLIATSSPVFLFFAAYVVPKVPLPRILPGS